MRMQIHTDDLPWLLSEWLPEGSLGVPADAQSGSQDFFLRLHGGVLGFALKAAGESSPTGWSVIRDELSKAPVLPAGLTYTLVLWSLNLAAEVRDAVGAAADKARFQAGTWYLSNGKLVQAPTADSAAPQAQAAVAPPRQAMRKRAPKQQQQQQPIDSVGTAVAADASKQTSSEAAPPKPEFVVANGSELIVVNPHVPSGGGLHELLGSRVLGTLRDMSRAKGGLSVALLADWTAPTGDGAPAAPAST
jgi:hypothetical protein